MAMPMQQTQERRPPLVLVSTKGLSREDWLQYRRQGIGSSDSAAILGLSKYNSPMMVYMDKLGFLPEREDNISMQVGRFLEEFVAHQFTRHTGWKTQRRNAILQHPIFPWMLANLDREFTHPEFGRCPLEIKTTGEFQKGDWDEEGKAPFSAQAQLMHQLAVTGAPYGALAVLIGNREFHWLGMSRDSEMIDAYLIPALSAFWGRVQAQDPPEWMGLENEEELLKAMYPEAEPGQGVSLPEDALQWRKEYWAAHAEASVAEARKKAAGCKLRDAIKGAEYGHVTGEVIATNKLLAHQRFDQSAFEQDHPALFAEYKRPAPYRRLDVKKGV